MRLAPLVLHERVVRLKVLGAGDAVVLGHANLLNVDGLVLERVHLGGVGHGRVDLVDIHLDAPPQVAQGSLV